MNKEEILKLNFAYIIYVAKNNPELAKKMLDLHYEDTVTYLHSLDGKDDEDSEN